MTTGELLVSLSDLETGTALEHLMSITGGGVVGTVLADFADLELVEANALDLAVDGSLDIEGDDTVELSGDDGITLASDEDLELDT